MPFQEDQLLFPFQPPVPPRNEDQLKDWADNLTRGLKEHQQQVVDKYNLHIRNAHAHPHVWKAVGSRRPSFQVTSTGGTTVTVPASPTNPAYFVIGEARQVSPSDNFRLLEATSDLTCDVSTSGVGGLDTGAVAATNDYYLYGIYNGGSAALIASASDPDTGPSGYNYGEWTYLGAFATNGSSQITPFNSVNGRAQYQLETESHSTSATSMTLQVWSAMPTTAYLAIFQATFSGTVVGSAGRMSSSSADVDSLATVLYTSGQFSYHWAWVPIFTAQTTWIKTDNATSTFDPELYGWCEDIYRWP